MTDARVMPSRGERDSVITVIKRLGRDLLTAIGGADPAPVPRRPRRGFWLPIGVLAVVGLVAISVRFFQDTRVMHPLYAGGLGILTVFPLVLLPRNPLWAWRIAFIGLFLGSYGQTQAEAWPWNPVQALVVLIVLFVVALREPPGVIFWIGLSAVAAVWTLAGHDNIAGLMVLIAAMLVLGEQIGRRRRIQRDLAVESERSEIAEARQAVLVERTRIARELHDVVAHSMSLVAVRAETAPYRLPDLPDTAREEFLALAGTARDSLTELRRLLGVLRTDAQPSLTPQPALSDLDDLVESFRDAGMEVTASAEGSAASGAVGLTVYRIVQEALSNAARHAPGAPVEILVTATKKEARVRVTNGPSTERAREGGTGHGLMGMRERVELLGGTLHTGPTSAGGFEVVAVVPTEPS